MYQGVTLPSTIVSARLACHSNSQYSGWQWRVGPELPGGAVGHSLHPCSHAGNSRMKASSAGGTAPVRRPLSAAPQCSHYQQPLQQVRAVGRMRQFCGQVRARAVQGVMLPVPPVVTL